MFFLDIVVVSTKRSVVDLISNGGYQVHCLTDELLPMLLVAEGQQTRAEREGDELGDTNMIMRIS